jgi:hypothetical protein
MSTPTRKSLDPTEQQHSKDKDDPLRSPDVPTRAHDGANGSREPAENERDHSPYGSKRGHTQTTVATGFIRNEDAPPLVPPQAPEDSRENPAERRHAAEIGGSRHHAKDSADYARALATPLPQKRGNHSRVTAFEDTAARRHLVDPDAAMSLQPAHPPSRQHTWLSSMRRDEAISDLDRLEAVLRQIERELPAARLPRAAQLPPVPGRHPIAKMSDNSYRSRFSLEPERLVPPAAIMSSGNRPRWPLGILIAGICALPIAYYFVVGGWIPPSAPGPQLASVDSKPVAPSSQEGARIKAQDDAPDNAQENDAERLVDNGMSSKGAKASRTARLSEREAVAMLRPDETGTQASPPKETVRPLDPEEIRFLAKQGEQFAAAGDLVAARTLLQRAAEANDTPAATALGATYDPTVLANLGVVGIDADLSKARFWYQKAASLGSSDAKRRLDLLANR